MFFWLVALITLVLFFNSQNITPLCTTYQSQESTLEFVRDTAKIPSHNFTRLKLAFLASIVQEIDPPSLNLSRFHFSIKRSITIPPTPHPDQLPVHPKVTPSILLGFPDNPLVLVYTPRWKEAWERKVSCPRTQPIDPVRSRTQTSRSRVQCTDHALGHWKTSKAKWGQSRSTEQMSRLFLMLTLPTLFMIMIAIWPTTI